LSLLGKLLQERPVMWRKMLFPIGCKISPETGTFNKLKSDQKIMDTMPERFNVDKAWDKLHNRLANHGEIPGTGAEAMPLTKHTWFLMTPFRIAASLLFLALIGASLFYLSIKAHNVTVTTTSNDRVRNITLPDGSSVYLNANTRLVYSKKFNRKSREISMVGEARSQPDKDKPFLINVNGACIKVVGTSFNVNAKNSNDQVEVYVSTGVVELFGSGNQENKVLLKPGFLGMISRNEIKSEQTNDENPLSWKTGNMNFQDTRLPEAVAILNNVFKAEIVCLEPALDTTRINGHYQYGKDPLETILNVICTQNHLRVGKSENKIYLSR
jgi:ferric-dicitrate binding protein FerR (iron transport regulator)